MSLLDQVVKHVRSFGHAHLGKEHQLLEEFATFLGGDAAVKAFLKEKGIKEGSDDHVVVSNFAAAIAPAAPEPVQAPVAEVAPVVEATPVVETAPAPQAATLPDAPAAS
jgi:hypothetical protein